MIDRLGKTRVCFGGSERKHRNKLRNDRPTKAEMSLVFFVQANFTKKTTEILSTVNLLWEIADRWWIWDEWVASQKWQTERYICTYTHVRAHKHIHTNTQNTHDLLIDDNICHYQNCSVFSKFHRIKQCRRIVSAKWATLKTWMKMVKNRNEIWQNVHKKKVKCNSW